MANKSMIPTLTNSMRPFPETVDVSMGISNANAMFAKHDVDFLLVQEEGQLIGVLSKQHLEILDSPLAIKQQADELMVQDVYSAHFLEVDIHAALEVVIKQMLDEHFEVVVVMRQGRIAGMLTQKEIAQQMCLLIKNIKHKSGNDVA